MMLLTALKITKIDANKSQMPTLITMTRTRIDRIKIKNHHDNNAKNAEEQYRSESPAKVPIKSANKNVKTGDNETIIIDSDSNTDNKNGRTLKELHHDLFRLIIISLSDHLSQSGPV